jgi:hypothetical protein
LDSTAVAIGGEGAGDSSSLTAIVFTTMSLSSLASKLSARGKADYNVNAPIIRRRLGPPLKFLHKEIAAHLPKAPAMGEALA